MSDEYFIERRDDGKYKVLKPGADRASAVADTQKEAIDRAKELNPDATRIRGHLEMVVKANPRWDGRVCVLQVTDTHFDHIELRCLVSAGDAALAFDLRCDVREAMMAFLTKEMPEALPRRRNEVIAATMQ